MTRTGSLDEYKEGLAEGYVRVTVCEGCGFESVTPRAFCPECGEREWSARKIEGVGTVYSATEIHVAGPIEEFEPPFTNAMIEFEGGARLLVHIREENVDVGDNVRLSEVVEMGDERVPIFETG